MTAGDRKPKDDWEDPTEIVPEELDLPEILDAEALAPIDHEEPGGPAFVVLERGQPDRVFFVHEDLLLGRGREANIPIASATVSRRHAMIVLTEEGCVLEDLLSDNGTFINGDRVERKVLWGGDTVRLGTVELHYLGETQEEQLWEGKPAIELPRLEWQLSGNVDSSTLMLDERLMKRMVAIRTLLRRGYVKPAVGTKLHKPGHGRIWFGGDDGLPISGLSKGRAAVVVWTGRKHQLRKLGRWTKVKVNGKAVTEVELEPGDEIQVGGSRFVYGLE